MLTREDVDLIALAKGRLDWSPKKNWVEEEGGLPEDIDKLAADLVKKGMTRERAIATAISRAKKWAATSANAKTRAKWGKAVAAWEAMKAKAKARPNKGEVKMSVESDEDVLMMSSVSYDMDKVRRAFIQDQMMYQRDFSVRHPEVSPEYIPHMSMKELWNDCVIAEDQAGKYYKARYVVTSGGDVVFGSPEEVVMQYVPVDEAMMLDSEEPEDDSEADDAMEYEDMAMSIAQEAPLLAKVLGLTKVSPLEKILKM